MKETVQNLEATVHQQSENMDKLAAALVHLADAVDERPTKTKTWTVVIAASLVSIFITLCLFAFVFVSTRDANRHQTELLKANNRNGDLIVDCTTPSTKTVKHKCFDRQQAAGNQFVAAITDSNHNGVIDVTEIINVINSK